jgi:RNA polymerase sigma factor (sigma-70 family)
MSDDVPVASEDEALIGAHLAIIAGAQSGIASLDEILRGRVLRMLKRHGVHPDDAEEAWNDALLAAAKDAPDLLPLGLGLKKFAIRVAYRRGIDTIRRAANRPQTELPEELSSGALAAPASNEARARRVNDCLEAAPNDYAVVAEMASRGLAASEIATVIDKTEGNAAKIRSRALAWLRRCLEGVLDA